MKREGKLNRHVISESVLMLFGSDVVLETRVFVSRRLEDKNESLGLGLK